MGKPEGYVEDYLREQIEELDGVCWKWRSGVRGVPDRVIVVNGYTVFVETKAKKGVLSALQKVQIGRIRRQGGDVRVIHTRELVDAFVDEVKGDPS